MPQLNSRAARRSMLAGACTCGCASSFVSSVLWRAVPAYPGQLVAEVLHSHAGRGVPHAMSAEHDVGK